MLSKYEIQKELIRRELAKKSILEFTRYVIEKIYEKPFVEAWFHGYIAELYQQVYLGNISEFLITIPPSYGKTMMTTCAIAWHIGIDPRSKNIYTSYGGDLSTAVSKEARFIVTHPAYKLLFPNVTISKDQDSKSEWETIKGGGVFATGTGGVVTGKHAPYGGVFIDDPTKASERNSFSSLQSAIDFYTDSLVSRRKDFIGCIMQRLNPHDLAGYLIENEEFFHLNLKALESRPIIYQVGRFKYQREANEVLYEAYEDFNAVQKKMKSLGSSASAQYQQEPETINGDFYKEEHFENIHIGEFDIPKTEKKHIIIDPAMSTKKTADNRAIVTIGISKTEDDAELFIVHDVLYGIWRFDDFIERILDTMYKYRDQSVWIELAGGGHIVIQELRKALVKRNTQLKSKGELPLRNRINEFSAKKTMQYKSKNEIIEACEPYFLSGHIKYKRTAQGLDQLTRELKSFDPTKDSPKDDCMECLAVAVTNPDIKAGKRSRPKPKKVSSRRKRISHSSDNWRI